VVGQPFAKASPSWLLSGRPVAFDCIAQEKKKEPVPRIPLRWVVDFSQFPTYSLCGRLFAPHPTRARADHLFSCPRRILGSGRNAPCPVSDFVRPECARA
jgi:hypothetical protein